jgi:hypothetical protein
MVRPDDRVLPQTRVTAAAVVVVLVLGSTSLLVFPGRTADLFAWKIGAQMTSMALGAGYAAGAYFFLRVLFARHWHTVALGFLPITAFTWLMEIATLIHWHVFIHGRFPFRFWIVIYSITPVLVPLVWFLNRSEDPGVPSERDTAIPPLARLILLAWGCLLIGLSAFLYLAPATASDVWPWPLTPLTSRVLGAWFAWGSFGLLVARDGRWSSARVVTQAMVVGTVLTLVGVARTWDEFDTGRPLTYLFLAVSTLGLVFLVGLHAAMEKRLRRSAAPSPTPSGADLTTV